MEQVCVALNLWCETWLKRRRGQTNFRHTGQVLRYRQKRNATARSSHKKRRQQPKKAM